MSRRARPLLAVAALVACVALAACGGGGAQDATALLRDTFSASHATRSGNLDVNLTVTGHGGQAAPEPTRVTLTGPFQSTGPGQPPSFDLAATFSGRGQNLQAGLTATGGKVYVSLLGGHYVAPPSTYASLRQAYQRSRSQGTGSKGQPSLGALGLHPLKWLVDPKVAGTTDVAGTPTEHITAGLDASALLADVNRALGTAQRLKLGATAGTPLPKQLTPDQRQRFAQAVHKATVDVYTGKSDHALRKLAVRVTAGLPPRSAGGLTSLDIGFSALIANRNQPQRISAPANAQPIGALKQRLAGLLSAATGQGGGGTPGAGGGSGAGSPGAGSAGGKSGGAPSSRYAQCIQQAGNDIAKAQKCAALLGR